MKFLHKVLQSTKQQQLLFKHKQQFGFSQQVKSIEEIKKFWDDNAESYLTQDCGLNGFYFTLINMLKIEKRKNILEVGAGGGFLYNHSLLRKHPDAHYYATDISDTMLQNLCRRMGTIYKPNQITKVNSYNLFIERANGEELHYKNDKFDCYIANLCLQITTHPDKMISEAFRVLQKGGYAGFTVWGDKTKSQFFTLVPQLLNQKFGIQLPEVRTSFHLNDKDQLIKLLEKQGFTNVISWNQFQPFPYVDKEDIQTLFTLPTIKESLEKAGDMQEEAKEALIKIFEDILLHKKQPIGLDGLMIIAKKPN